MSTTSMDVLNFHGSSTSFNHQSAVSLDDENSVFSENKKRNICVEGHEKTAEEEEDADGGDKKRKRV
jgi:hypothetical protein